MDSKPSGKLIDSRDWHSLNVYSPTDTRFADNFISFSAVQPQKAIAPTVSTPSGNTTFSRLLQFKKVLLHISSIFNDNFICSNEEQLENTPSPIEVTLSGILILVIRLLSAKALSPMAIT